MNYGLRGDEIEKIIAVFKKYTKVDKVILYGSRAMGKYKPGSDIDLTVIGKLKLKELNNITSDLDELVLPFRFDVSLNHQISNLDLLDHINRVGVVFYTKKPNYDPKTH